MCVCRYSVSFSCVIGQRLGEEELCEAVPAEYTPSTSIVALTICLNTDIAHEEFTKATDRHGPYVGAGNAYQKRSPTQTGKCGTDDYSQT